MKAMILAAGLGTRLRPLTDDCPKALVTVAGHTLLEITLSRLRSFGVSDVIVNAHHHAQMIVDYLHAHNNFGMKIEVSLEEQLLDTGGGLKKAAHFFSDTPQEPFLLHNVDVLSNIDLGQMVRFHSEKRALATLAVQDRVTSRYLLFDEQGQLCGRRAGVDGEIESLHFHNNPDAAPCPIHSRSLRMGGKAQSPLHENCENSLVRPAEQLQPLAFSGIHVLSPLIFEKMKEQRAFSIIDAYLHLAAQGEKIVAFRAGGYYWRDLGRPENLLEAAQDIATGKFSAPLCPTS
jgi:NDP-sugar pyrophosphorylase family protein